ncbi:unnamed protein product, partial [marine sediment metagenome]
SKMDRLSPARKAKQTEKEKQEYSGLLYKLATSQVAVEDYERYLRNKGEDSESQIQELVNLYREEEGKKMRNVGIRNMTGRTGREVANQFIMNTKEGTYFQSYNTIIAFQSSSKTQLDANRWDCSTTTGKYRNQFLGETKKETEAKIKSGEYELVDLN